LILLMFVAEYLVRLRTLPHLEHDGFMDGIRTFWKTEKVPTGASAPTR